MQIEERSGDRGRSPRQQTLFLPDHGRGFESVFEALDSCAMGAVQQIAAAGLTI
jgi:hypothetical protein